MVESQHSWKRRGGFQEWSKKGRNKRMQKQ
jgi:hypothetical protein